MKVRVCVRQKERESESMCETESESESMCETEGKRK